MFNATFLKIIGVIFGISSLATPIQNTIGTTVPKQSQKIEVSKKIIPKVTVSTQVTQPFVIKPGIKRIKAKSGKNPIVKIETSSQTTATPEPAPDFVAINTSARSAVVNILCTPKGSELSPISGTGVIIDPSGIILTNAHLGEYWLLKDFREKNFLECIARTGSPAYPKYHTELIYISPNWIQENKTILKEENPKGTGENDFAFIRITDNIDGSPLPTSFPYITPNTRETFEKGEPVLLAGYPAGFLGGLSILEDLSITSALTTIQDIFTFKETTMDLLSVGGTVISQKGASGGAVVDGYNTLIGIISTSSLTDNTSTRDLRAITLAHINRSLQSELGITLSQFLQSDLVTFGHTFASTTAPLLTKIISDPLLGK